MEEMSSETTVSIAHGVLSLESQLKMKLIIQSNSSSQFERFGYFYKWNWLFLSCFCYTLGHARASRRSISISCGWRRAAKALLAATFWRGSMRTVLTIAFREYALSRFMDQRCLKRASKISRGKDIIEGRQNLFKNCVKGLLRPCQSDKRSFE